MNKVILMGRLTRDPNVRYTQQNGSQESMCVARYTLAVDRRGARDGLQSQKQCHNPCKHRGYHDYYYCIGKAFKTGA